MRFASRLSILAAIALAMTWHAPTRCAADDSTTLTGQPEAAPAPAEGASGETPAKKARKARGPRPTPPGGAVRHFEIPPGVTLPPGFPGTQPTTTTAPSTGPTTTTAPSTSPTTSATTTASGIAPTPPFPAEYSMLLKRSMFARGAPKPPSAGPAQAQGPESMFGLRGIGVLDGVFIAMIENTAEKSVKQMKEGESVGAGKIKNITIDGIVYDASGKSTKVAIGQNLAGAPLPPPPPPAPKPEQPQPGAQPGQPQPGQPGQPQPGQPMRIRNR